MFLILTNMTKKKCTFPYKWFNGVQHSWGQIKISGLPEKIAAERGKQHTVSQLQAKYDLDSECWSVNLVCASYTPEI